MKNTHIWKIGKTYDLISSVRIRIERTRRWRSSRNFLLPSMMIVLCSKHTIDWYWLFKLNCIFSRDVKKESTQKRNMSRIEKSKNTTCNLNHYTINTNKSIFFPSIAFSESSFSERLKPSKKSSSPPGINDIFFDGILSNELNIYLQYINWKLLQFFRRRRP